MAKCYKTYSSIISKIENTYSDKYNLYNLLMHTIKSIKQNKDIRDSLKDIFKNFSSSIDELIFIMEYLKAKKCKSYNVYCELLLYFRQFKDGRINSDLNFQ